MQSVKHILITISRIYIRGIEWISSFIMVLVALAMLQTVFSRAVLHSPISAIDKIIIILVIWACFLLNGNLILENNHIQINLLPEKLKGVQLSILRLLTNFFLLVICTITSIYGFKVTMLTFETGVTYTAEIAIPQWPTFLAVCLGMALAVPPTLYCIVKDILALCDYLKNIRS